MELGVVRFGLDRKSSVSLGITLLLAVVVLSLVWVKATPYMFAATLSYFTLVTGLVLRKVRKVHASLMTAGILLDVAIVLVLEFQRHAINTAISFTLSPLQQAHIGFSTLATLLYFPILYIGYRALKGPTPDLRKWHLRLGITAFIFRTLGFLTMFTLLSRLTVSL